MPDEPAPGLRILGILGGIGSGKSTAARALAAALPGRVEVLEADAEVDRLLADPAVVSRLAEVLDRGILDTAGGVDRHLLAARIFADDGARRRVEAILHPAVRAAQYARMAALEAAGGAAWAVLDVPLLAENGLDAHCDSLIFVDAPPEIRAERACARHGWSEAQWRAREAAQMPLEEKRARANAILDNHGGPAHLEAQIQALLARLHALPARPLAARWPRPEQSREGRAGN